jgi:hypothetical protein
MKPFLPENPPASASGTSGTRLEKVAPFVYGHSYTVSPGSRCTAGAEFFTRLVDRIGLDAATTYGVAGSLLLESAMAMIGGAFNGIGAGALWPAGTRKGVVFLDAMFNDMGNYTSQVDITPKALTTPQVTGYKHALRTFLAIASASARTEEPGSGTDWTVASPTAPINLSGGQELITTTPNASFTMNVTVPASGVLYALTYACDPLSLAAGTIAYKIGGTTYGSLDQTGGDQMASVFSNNGGAPVTGYPYAPAVVKLTGLPTGAQTITVQKTDGGAGYALADAIFTPAASPPPIVVIKDPLPNPDASAALFSSGQIATLTANRALLSTAVESVCAEFSNAIVVDPALVPATDLSAVDGVHPNERGMAKMADAIESALTAWLVTNDPDYLYATV